MKIDNINAVEADRIRKSQNIKTDKNFAFTLESHIDEANLSETLNKMADDIYAQGKVLSENMDLKEFKKYKGMVTDFMNEIVSTSHKFSRENFLDRRGRHKIYGLIRLVNTDVDKIAQEMIKTEKNHLTILEKIDEIRGLLLDIIT